MGEKDNITGCTMDGSQQIGEVTGSREYIMWDSSCVPDQMLDRPEHSPHTPVKALEPASNALSLYAQKNGRDGRCPLWCFLCG